MRVEWYEKWLMDGETAHVVYWLHDRLWTSCRRAPNHFFQRFDPIRNQLQAVERAVKESYRESIG